MSAPPDVLVKPLTFFGSKVFVWAKTKLVGRRLLIAGPGRTGKTTFKQFLHTGELYPEKPTPHTEEDEASPPIQIGYGADRRLTLNVKRTMDTAGLTEAHVVVSSVLNHRPHGLIIIVDCSRSDSKQWVEAFFKRLGERISDSTLRAWRARRALKYVALLLNKADKVKPEALENFRASALDAAKLQLVSATGTLRDRIEVFHCTLIKPPGSEVDLKPIVTSLCWHLQ
jgi:hypothetical protein